MPESFRNRLTRWKFNHHPAYRGTGGHITYISDDWHEAHVKLDLNRTTRNLVGTMFGGSLYGAVDPIYMILLMHCLGPEYVVWDQAASIQFKKPARTTVFAKFILNEVDLNSMRSELTRTHSLQKVYAIDLTDAAGVVYSVIEKTLYVRRKQPPAQAPG